jgi:hypothetical protein
MALAIALVFLCWSEPQFQGTRLSEWVEGYGKTMGKQWPKEARNGVDNPDPTDQAILQIGTKSLPWLVEWIRYETPAWKERLHRTLNPLLGQINSGWRLSDERLRQRAEGAQVAFWVLGPDVAAAIPDLDRIMNDPVAGPAAFRAARSLLRADARAVPALTKALTNGQTTMPARSAAASALGRQGINATSAVPALMRCLVASNEVLVANALAALLTIRDPVSMLPETVKLLRDPRPRVRQAAISAVPAGVGGRSALPALTQLQTDGDLAVRRAATNAIRRIDKLPNGKQSPPSGATPIPAPETR